QQIQHVRRLSHVAEVRGQDRIECLTDQPTDIAKSLDHAWRLLIVDMQHQRQRQHRLVTVCGNELNTDQVLVVLVRFSLAGNPAQDKIHRRDELDLNRIWVYGVFATWQGFFPNPALAELYLLSIPKRFTRQVYALA